MTQLIKGQILELPVDGVKEINNITCYIVTYDDGEVCKQYPISLLKFQRESTEGIPDTLRCVVIDINPATGDFTLGQDFSQYIQRFYQIGQSYEFTVQEWKSKNNLHDTNNIQQHWYTISDPYGFYFTLKDSSILYRYQRIKCKVTEMAGAFLGLKLEKEKENANTNSKGLPHRVAEQLKKHNKEIDWNTEEFVDFLFDAQTDQVFDEECTEWMHTLASFTVDNHAATTHNNIDTQNTQDNKNDNDHCAIIKQIKDDCLWLLEQSDTLKLASSGERAFLQNRLSISIDVASRFIEAVGIVETDSHESYVKDLLSRLSKSGYIYQPQHKLGVLVTLFSLKPELRSSRMNDILYIIQESPLELWREDPFRSAFIKLIEMYIRTSRTKADFAALEGGEQVAQIIKALAMELCLVQTLSAEQKKALPFDLQLNRAMLYRYASYISSKYQRTLLELAFRCLMDLNISDNLNFSWNDTKNIEVLAEKMATIEQTASDEQDIHSDLDNILDNSLIMKTYKGDKIQLRIGDAGLQIASVHEEDSEPVLPEDLLPWHQQQVLINGGLKSAKQRSMKSLNGKNNDNLNSYQALWSDIEVALTTDRPKTRKMEHIKTLPEQGEEVDIRIDRLLDDYDEPAFHCVIEMDNIKGEGVMMLTDIVNWNPYVTAAHFVDKKGDPFIFPAKVISINPDGQCRFTMLKLIREYVHETITFGSRFTMIVKSIKGNGLNGVSMEGYPLNATISGEPDAPVQIGDYVIVEMDTDDDLRRGNVSTTFIQHSPRCSWDESEAFKNLMYEYSIDTWHEVLSDDKAVTQADAQLDTTYVHELMLLLDRQAAAESTIRAYNYLGMARIFAILLNDTNAMQYYKWRMELLKMLHEFSINDMIDATKLAEFETLNKDSNIFTRASQLHFRFMQLLIVSYRNNPQHNAGLWSIISNENEEPGLRNLASLVLSLNMLKDFDLERTGIEINNKIFDILNLKQRISSHKYYGNENKTTEFKTSIVYPPDNNMRPDYQKQIQVMLKVLCAFMNTEGGTLYIGVNNEGMGIGIENDLAYKLFQYSPDKYDVFFHNQVKFFLGLEANSLIETSFDENEDGSIVYIVRVKPFDGVMMLGDKVYERQSTSCELLTGSYLDSFCEKRGKTTPVIPDEVQTEDTPTEEPKTTPSVRKEPTKKITTDKIATSQKRNNVIFNWEENYEEPVAFIRFLPDSEYSLVKECYDDDAELTLAIHEHERNAFLVLIYENGYVAKVSLKEILEKEYYKEYKRLDSKLVFACPAFENDIIFTTVRTDNGLQYYRTDKLVDFDKDNITSEGRLLYELQPYTIDFAEIVPGIHAEVFRPVPGRSIGTSIVKGDGSLIRNSMKELGYDID